MLCLLGLKMLNKSPKKKEKDTKDIKVNIDKKVAEQKKKEKDILDKKKLDKLKKKNEKKKKYEDNIKINKFIAEWEEMMAHLSLGNKLGDTYTPTNVVVTPYGFNCRIETAKGLGLNKILSDDIIDVIESNFSCMLVTDRPQRSNYVNMKFIMNVIPNVVYEPVKLKPWELYLGTAIDGSYITVDMINTPHILVQGSTGMGKTKLIDLMMVNLLVTNPSDKVGLFVIETDKSDPIIYQRVKHCKGYARTLIDMLSMLNYLLEFVTKRENILRPLKEKGICSNIDSYNKAIKDKKIDGELWDYNYLTIDEYATLMPNDEYDQTSKALKQAIQGRIGEIIKISRATGLYIIIGTQRATIDKLPSFIKAMSNVNVTFRVNNRKSSEVAIDSDKACYLEPRNFIVKLNDIMYGKTVTLYDDTIFNYLQPLRYPEPRYPSYNQWDNSEIILAESNKKGGRKSKKERKQSKKENINTQNTQKTNEIPVEYEKLIKKQYDNDKKEVKIINYDEKQSEIVEKKSKTVANKSNIDIPKPKSSSPTYIEGWEDITKKKGINVIDQTKIPTKTEKPIKKGDVDSNGNDK